MDKDLLTICRQREHLLRFKPLVRPEILGKETGAILNGMEQYFKDYPSEEEIADWNAFGEWYLTLRSGQIRKETADLLRKFFDTLTDYTLSVTGEDILRFYLRASLGSHVKKLASDLENGADSDDYVDEIGELLKEYDVESKRQLALDDQFATFDFNEVSDRAQSPGFKWRLAELNASCGPTRRGDFIIVAARPETGKTTFMASEMSFLAQQLHAKGDGRPIVWMNNEEQDSKVAFRIMQAALGITGRDILDDKAAAQAKFEALCGKNRFILPRSDAGFNHRVHIERLLKERQPAALVFDQLDKVGGFAGDEEHLVLGHKYQWARNLAHEYGPVFAVSQVSGEGEGQQYIYMNQLRGSKTDKAAEADLIITIGRLNDSNRMEDRFIHLPKNKLFGPLDEAQRHGFWDVRIEPQFARYKGNL